MEAKKLPDVSSLVIDKENYYKQAICGYYNFDCYVNENKTRTVKFYIPEGTRLNQPTIFVLVPGGNDTYEFLEQSGWKKMADEKKQHIVLLEAENGTWGNIDEEIAYVNAVNEDVSYRPYFCAFAANFYAIAYKETAKILAKQALNFPKGWAGIALIGDCGLSKDEEKELKTKETKVPLVYYSDIQMPVWISVPEETEDSQRLVSYYRKANHSFPIETSFDTPLIRLLDEKLGAPIARHIYEPSAGGTIDEHHCARVISEIRQTTISYELADAFYDSICKGVCRYPGNNNGALRKYPNIVDRGFEKFTAMVSGGYYEDGHDKYQREWWVYVPETADLTKPLPVVFVFHGAGGSADEIADRSGWSDVARKHGFMIVCPGASCGKQVRNVSNMITDEMFRYHWHVAPAKEDRPNDLLFVEYLYKWVIDNYPVDQSRIYASGQSSGGMMSWNCATCLPDYFAACAPVSAKGRSVNTPTLPIVDGSIIPLMCCLGLEDKLFGHGFQGDVKELINHWYEAFHLTKDYDSYSYADGGKNCSYKEGLFTNYIYANKDEVPLLRCVEVDTKAHAIWPTECEMIWTEWFTNFTKDPKTKDLYYKGTKVEK